MPHGLSTSLWMANSILYEAAKHHAQKVVLVEIELGKLACFNPEQLLSWLEMGLDNTLAEGAEIKIETTEPEISCNACGYLGPLVIKEEQAYPVALPCFSCPACNSPEIRIEKGRECKIRRIGLILRDKVGPSDD